MTFSQGPVEFIRLVEFHAMESYRQYRLYRIFVSTIGQLQTRLFNIRVILYAKLSIYLVRLSIFKNNFAIKLFTNVCLKGFIMIW